MSKVCVIFNRCTCRLWPEINSCLFAILFIHIKNKYRLGMLKFILLLNASLSTNFSPIPFLTDFSVVMVALYECLQTIYLPHYIPYISCGRISVQGPQSLLHRIPLLLLTLKGPCDALIVEVTGMGAEFAKPPVNPIKWSELPVVWRELAICFQDLSTQRSKVLLLCFSTPLTENSGRKLWIINKAVEGRSNETGIKSHYYWLHGGSF